MSNRTITVKYEDFAFEISFDYFKATRGAREHGTGLQLEPDDPESWEVTQISMIHPTDPKIKPADVTDCFSEAMLDWFDEQIGDHIYEVRYEQ